MMREAFLCCFFVFTAYAFGVNAQTTAFTYQGQLTDGTAAANGTYGMTFSLFNAVTGGSQQGSTITNNTVTVTDGIFTVQLDFTATPLAAGANRWLQIGVKKPADPGFTTLTPRQPITASPYSIRTLSAASADSLSIACVGCVNDAKIATVSGSKITGEVASSTTAGNVTGTVAVANGGTGSTTQNFVDLKSNQTIAGNKTFTGTLSGNGSGLSTVVRVTSISSTINTVLNGPFAFAGSPTPFFPVAAGQRLTGAAVASLGLSSGSDTIQAGICYQKSAGPVETFARPPEDDFHVLIDTVRRPIPVTGTVVIGVAGSYRVGFCVRSSEALDNNDRVNGWVMLTND